MVIPLHKVYLEKVNWDENSGGRKGLGEKWRVRRELRAFGSVVVALQQWFKNASKICPTSMAILYHILSEACLIIYCNSISLTSYNPLTRLMT